VTAPSSTIAPAPAGVDPSAPRACWTALRYELPADDAPTRARLWRQLRSRRAINVHRGLWAVPHDRAGRTDLEPVVARLRSAGATVGLHVVGRGDAELLADLTAACERLWTRFVESAGHLTDRLVSQVGDGHRVGDLSSLHDRFARTLAEDLALSPAAGTAARRLDELEWIVANVRGRETGSPPLYRPTVEVISTIRLDDGCLRAVARLVPPPPVSWERDLADFEAATYRADAGRRALRHGTVVVTGTPDEVVAALSRVSHRIGRFNVTLS
jgi:hypothetical protein